MVRNRVPRKWTIEEYLAYDLDFAQIKRGIGLSL